jgi:FkbM family methyltransferase
MSVDASEMIPHHSLDFVYLDARHDYTAVLEDLEAWFDKVRPGGILAGHDYLDGTFPAGVFGVKSAVDEFLGERGIAVYSTSQDQPWVTWMAEIPAPAASIVVPASLPATNADSLAHVSIAFEANGVPRQVKLKLDPSHFSQRIMLAALQRNEIYEPDTCGLLTTVLREGDTFVDVGTHVGFFSTLAASIVGDSGRVVSFEPEERNFKQLQEHVSINGFSNVDPVCAAVGAEETVAEFWVNSDNDGGHALWDVGLHGFNEKSRSTVMRRSVPVTTLDSHFAKRGATPPKLIKIDAEGCELQVLRGAEGLLRRRVPYVVLEINHFALEQMGTSETALRAYMTDLGYETNALHPETGEIIPLTSDQRVNSQSVFNLFFRHETAPLVRPAA